ncbi:hypothetical protein ABPG74_000590 [Tetrahymena malaccensis]
MSQKLLLVIIFSALICSVCADQGSLVEALQAYNKFTRNYPRIYLNEAESDYRLAIFLENYQRIQDHNNNPENTYQIGVNRFSDMTLQEFYQKILQNPNILSKGKNYVQKKQAIDEAIKPAISIDWRTKGVVTPVKNQGECGSCWAFSATAAMESYNAIHNKVLLRFSEQEFVDCTTEANGGFYSFGCEGGVPGEAIRYASLYGVKTEAEYPYVGIQGSCNTTNSTTTKFRPVSYESLPETTEALKIALNHAPVSISLDATYLGDYVSGVFDCKNQTIQINHAVLAVGYDEKGNWILKNSWADDWGQQGYFLLAPDNACGILETGVEITA